MLTIKKMDQNFTIVKTDFANLEQDVYFSYETPVYAFLLLNYNFIDVSYSLSLPINNITKYSATTTRHKKKFIYNQKDGVLQLADDIFKYLLNFNFKNNEKNLKLFIELCNQKEELSQSTQERIDKIIILKELGQDLGQLLKDFFLNENF